MKVEFYGNCVHDAVIFCSQIPCKASVMQTDDGDNCVPRLRIAFKWMVRAFSGYLSTDQLLLLWDRVLGYDSLEVVAGIALRTRPQIQSGYLCGH